MKATWLDGPHVKRDSVAQIVALRKKGHSFVHLLSPPSSTYLFSSDAAAAADAAP